MTSTTRKTDRFSNRAPKGGAVSSVNGLFYKDGRFMPMTSTPVEAKPAPLAGSSRQVAWANRLRAEALANLNDEINVRRIFLAEAKTKAEAKLYRQGVKPLLIVRHNLMTERSASAVIARHVSAN